MAVEEKWREEAACRDKPVDLFFPAVSKIHDRFNEYGREAMEAIAKAKAICATCPVSGACLDYALKLPEKHGLWGGLDERQRAKLRKSRRRDARRSA